MRRYPQWMALGTALAASAIALAGCAERAARPVDRSGAAPRAEERAADAPTPPPADSKLALVKKGMKMSEVVKILGEPTDRHQYVTGKAFIPWYFGDDASRVEWHYRGLGRVVLTGGGAFGQGGGIVEWVDYDPKESGYRK